MKVVNGELTVINFQGNASIAVMPARGNPIPFPLGDTCADFSIKELETIGKHLDNAVSIGLLVLHEGQRMYTARMNDGTVVGILKFPKNHRISFLGYTGFEDLDESNQIAIIKLSFYIPDVMSRSTLTVIDNLRNRKTSLGSSAARLVAESYLGSHGHSQGHAHAHH